VGGDGLCSESRRAECGVGVLQEESEGEGHKRLRLSVNGAFAWMLPLVNEKMLRGGAKCRNIYGIM
jgi:hypothetical protein